MTTTRQYCPTHLARWIERVNYEGKDFDGFYIGAWRPFKSTPIGLSNFEYVARQVLDTGTHRHQARVVRFTDEILLARFYLLIHPDADRALRMADMLAKRIARTAFADPEQEICMDATMNYPGAVAGHFAMVSVGGMELMTTLTGERKMKAAHREAEARARVLAEIEALTGEYHPRVNRGIDGVRRRWVGVKSQHAD